MTHILEAGQSLNNDVIRRPLDFAFVSVAQQDRAQDS